MMMMVTGYEATEELRDLPSNLVLGFFAADDHGGNAIWCMLNCPILTHFLRNNECAHRML